METEDPLLYSTRAC